MIKNTIIIYLIGKSGIGKYTIAKELAKINNFVICDNQLINNPIFELLQYDGYSKIPDFAWESIARIRSEILRFLCINNQNSYILTNCLAENEDDKLIYQEVCQMAKARGSLFIPVQFQISKQEHLRRLTQLDRKMRWKSINPIDAEDNGPLISICDPNLLELNISNLSAEDVAMLIMVHINKFSYGS